MAAESLEQRLYDLLQPYRNDYYNNHLNSMSSLQEERLFMILCENIAFLAHNHIANTEHTINTSDVLVMTRGWTGDGVAIKGGAIAVLVRYPEGAMGVVKATFEAGVGVIDVLYTKVDDMIAENFWKKQQWL
ncbi:hypothetical protein G6011_09110 [Alternaria panax]|uniref:Uncharacterized protein n=1 Tax=Alternaria panax TaxID=48097 RepID=A0AAD4IAG9_9PLEO|nr:hypothetical protein G6011_09110 [Alternaria panax]